MATGRKAIPHWKWLVEQERITRQIQGLSLTLQYEKTQFYGVFPPSLRSEETREYLRQLEIELAKMQIALDFIRSKKALEIVRSPRVWDRLLIRLYYWAVYNK